MNNETIYPKGFKAIPSPNNEKFPDHTWDFFRIFDYLVKIEYSCSKFEKEENLSNRKINKVYVEDHRGHEMIFRGDPTDFTKFGMQRNSIEEIAHTVSSRKFIEAFRAPFYWYE